MNLLPNFCFKYIFFFKSENTPFGTFWDSQNTSFGTSWDYLGFALLHNHQWRARKPFQGDSAGACLHVFYINGGGAGAEVIVRGYVRNNPKCSLQR